MLTYYFYLLESLIPMPRPTPSPTAIVIRTAPIKAIIEVDTVIFAGRLTQIARFSFGVSVVIYI
jgi:hypothetical protein